MVLIALMLIGTAASNRATAAPVKNVQNFSQSGKASWYGPGFHGRKTSNGERFNMNALTAAHRTLPLPSYVRVTNLSNNKSIIVRVNDRGPFHGNRVMDLSKGAAKQLGFLGAGMANITINSLDASSDNVQLANTSTIMPLNKVNVNLPKANRQINLAKVSREKLNSKQATTITKSLFTAALTQGVFAAFAPHESTVYLDSKVFGSLKEADKHLLTLMDKMRAAHLNYPIILVENESGKGYRVRIGPFKESQLADKIKRQLAEISA